MTAPRLQELKKMMGMSERREVEEPEDRGEKSAEGPEDGKWKKKRLEAVEKILKVLTCIEMIQGAKGQPLEEKEGKWIFYIIVALAMFGAICLIGCCGAGCALFWKWSTKEEEKPKKRMKKIKEKEKTEEKIQSPDEEEEEVNRMIRRQEDEEKRRFEVVGVGKEEVSPVRRDPDARSSETRRRTRNPPLITDWGARWHSIRNCPTLQVPSNINEGTWCRECAPEGTHRDLPIYTVGPGREAHLSTSCPRATHGARRFHKCQKCIEKGG